MVSAELPDIEHLKDRKNKRGLVEALSYRADIQVRLAAAQALKELGWSPANNEEAALYSIAKGKFTWCLELGAAAIGPLCAALPDPDERVRRQAALALGKLAEQLNDPQTSSTVTSAVMPLLVDPVDEVRGAARAALTQCGAVGIEALCELAIEGETSQVKLAALDLLAENGLVSMARLKETILSRSWLLQAGDLKILGESQDARWLDILIEFLESPQNWPARASAAEALANLGQPQAVEPLIKVYFEACAVNDQIQLGMKAAEFEPVYRAVRSEVLAQPELAPEAELLLAAYRPAALLDKTGGDLPAIRSLTTACMEALSHMGGKRAANSLILALRIPAAKGSTVQALSIAKDKRAVPGLRALCSEKDRTIRWEAEAVLKQLGEEV
jgi:HEAT repeat protein